MSNPYGYINGRVRMMRSGLLDPRALDETVSAVNYQEYLRQVSETSLREDLGDATAQGAGLGQLDQALSRNYLRAVQQLRSIATGQPAQEIEALLLRYDLQNVKTLVRGVNAGRSADDIVAGLIPAGTIPWSALQSAAQSTDLASLAQTLSVAGGKIGGLLRSAVSGTGNLLDTEVALDQGYYRSVLSGVRGSNVRRYFSREIDVRNLLIARQLRGSSPNVRYFIPGGRDVSEADFLRIAGGDNSVSAPDLQAIMETPDLGAAEAISRRVLDEASRNVAMADALGPGVALDFLRRKEQEIARLRLIARAKFYGLSREELQKELEGA